MTDNLWDTASGEIEATAQRRDAALAMAEADRLWPFLAAASSREEYEQRLAIVDPGWSPEIVEAFEQRFAALMIEAGPHTDAKSQSAIVWETVDHAFRGNCPKCGLALWKDTKHNCRAKAAEKTAETHPPYRIEERDGKHVVVNDNGDVKGTHDTKDQAREQQKALYANVPGASEKAKESAKTAHNLGVCSRCGQEVVSGPGYEGGEIYDDEGTAYHADRALDADHFAEVSREDLAEWGRLLASISEEEVLEAEAMLAEGAFFPHRSPQQQVAPRTPEGTPPAPESDLGAPQPQPAEPPAPPQEDRSPRRRSRSTQGSQHTERAYDLLMRHEPTPDRDALRHRDLAQDLLSRQHYGPDVSRPIPPPHLLDPNYLRPASGSRRIGPEDFDRTAATHVDRGPSNLHGEQNAEVSEVGNVVRPPMTTRPRVHPQVRPGTGYVTPGEFAEDPEVPTIAPVDYANPTFAQQVAAKVARVAAQVAEDNPHLSVEATRALAMQALATYPEMVRK